MGKELQRIFEYQPIRNPLIRFLISTTGSVNVFFDGVDSTPALEDLYNLLNLLLLVDALMISLAIGFPGIYGYDDLIEAVARFNGAAGDDDEYDINRYYHQWCMKTQNTNGDFPKDKCGVRIYAFSMLISSTHYLIRFLPNFLVGPHPGLYLSVYFIDFNAWRCYVGLSRYIPLPLYIGLGWSEGRLSL